MNCKHVRRQLSAYVDGELAGDEMLLIRHHLSECADCEREHEEIRQTKIMLSSLSAAIPRKAFLGDISAALDQVQPSGHGFFLRSFHNKYIKTGLASAACALAMVALYVSGVGSGPTHTESANNPSNVSTESPISVFSTSAQLPCIPRCMRNDTLMLVEGNTGGSGFVSSKHTR